MIPCHIKIGDGAEVDTFAAYKMAYLSSCNILEPPIKEFDKTSYAEEPGCHIYPKSVPSSFDYTVKFLIITPNSNMDCANERIQAFNNAICETDEDGIRTYKTVTLWNYYKRVMVVGVPKPLSEATSFYRNRAGMTEEAVEVELTIMVPDPSECNFSLQLNS